MKRYLRQAAIVHAFQFHLPSNVEEAEAVSEWIEAFDGVSGPFFVRGEDSATGMPIKLTGGEWIVMEDELVYVYSEEAFHEKFEEL